MLSIDRQSGAPSYYAAVVPEAPQHVPLAGDIVADVCVVGGGVAGCSTALHLAERGYRVVLVEAHDIGWGSSGRSGGQVLVGYACDQSTLVHEVGAAAARQLWDISVEALDLVRERVAKHAIECDLHWGHLHAAIKPRHRTQLAEFQEQVAREYGYDSLRLLERRDVEALLATQRYSAGLYDSFSGHLQPLAYTIGLARAAFGAGAQIYTHSPVVDVRPGERVRVSTGHGSVSASFVVLCCNAYMGTLIPALSARTVPAVTYLAATQRLIPGRLQDIIRQNISVADANFVLDYFRRSNDERLLFGGRVSYSGMSLLDIARIIRRRMLRVFPQLADVGIEYAWSGNIDLTVNRAPDFNRLAPNIYYLQGFSGHGLALAGMAGKIVASAIAGQAERFDLFAKLEHRAFPGGNLLRAPALALAMLWYRLRDAL